MFRNVQVLLSASSGNLRSQLMAAAREVDTFGKKVESSSAAATSSSKALSVAAKGVAAGAVAAAVGLGYSVKAASEFETRMRNVNSISGLSEKALSALGGEVLDLSRALPQSANVLAEGLYEIASSGFQGAEGLKVLEAAAKAASAGLTTTAVSGKAITAVLNAYGLGAESATDVSDTLFQTVNLGVVSFEELSSVIGDTIGTAAAAAVSIDQVGAAVATMTLAGISGAESATSLNRLLQELIQPSDSLALALNQLGYESGTQALKVDGLHGVMEKLRVATGGNVASLLRLFPEIRAARGALALMSKEGENYNRVAAGIEDKNTRTGATARALAEQMKALSAQWTLFRNRANAAAVELGTRLIPTVLATINAVQQLGASVLPTLQHAMAALAPFFANVVQIGGDLVDVAKGLIDALGPAAKVIAGIVAAGVITALNSLSTVLATITGFLADNQFAVTALAAAIGAKFVPVLAAAVLWLGRLGVMLAGDLFAKMAVSAYTAAGGVGALSTAAVPLSGVLGGLAARVAPILAIGVAVSAVTSAFTTANKRAKELVATVTDDMDRTTFDGLSAGIEELGRLREAQIATGDSSSSLGNAYRGAVQALTPLKNSVADAQAKVDALNSSMVDLDRKASNQFGNVSNVLLGLKLPDDTYQSWARLRPEVEAMAKKLGVDLTQGGEAGKAGVDKVVGALVELQTKSGTSSAALVNGGADSLAKMEELATAIDKVALKVSEAFASDTDFISAFKPDAAEASAAAIKNAKDELIDARLALDDLTARSRDKTTQDASSQRALEKARERVAEAQGKVNKAQSEGVTQGGQIANFYTEQIRLTSQFATDLTTAASKGLDPEIISRLVAVGPEQAAPILQALLSDHSGALIRMANESEQKLREIGERTVEFSRLTQQAIASGTDTMARDLGTAMKIAAANMEQGTKATVDTIAAAIGSPSADVLRVAEQFGITLATKVSSAFAAAIRFDVSSAVATIAARTPQIKSSGTLSPDALAAAVPGTPYRPRSGSRARVRFADGGIDGLPEHATISRPKGPRGLIQWAEPETGGEAFIPLTPAKRSRSTKILTEVAERFGLSVKPSLDSYAEGGIHAAGRIKPPRLEEDEVPPRSRAGAKLVRFEKGRATYADGSTLTAEGWGGFRFNPAAKLDASQVEDRRRDRRQPARRTTPTTRHHEGGTIDGPRGADVPMIGQAGEYVLRAAAVEAIGVPTLEKLNQMTTTHRETFHSGGLVGVPTFHQGGQVTRTMPSVPAGGSNDNGALLRELQAMRTALAAVPTSTIDASVHADFKRADITRAELDYLARQQAFRLAAVVRR